MVSQNEILALLLVAAGALFLLIARSFVRRLPAPRVFVAAYGFFCAASTFTVLEGFTLPHAFNLAEHVSYAACAVGLLLWTWVAFGRGEGESAWTG